LSRLDHLLREPAGEPQGSLVLNHGRGTDERDLFGLFDELDPQRRLLGVSPGGPLRSEQVAKLSALPVAPGGRHWYAVKRVGYPEPETFGRAYRLLSGFLDDLLAERGISWERTAVGGFSMGAVMSYAIGLGKGRPRPAGILALSGFIPQVDGWEARLDERRGLPVLIHHGRADPVIEVDFGRRAAALLSAGGLTVDYVESDAGHELPPALLQRMRDFLVRAGILEGDALSSKEK
jgi:phospholipase/carboxylesterase